MKHICSIDKRKKEVMDLLEKLNLQSEYIKENEIKIFGKADIYGKFLETGHFYLEKQSKRLNRRVHKWTCAGMQAIESYLRQHALNLPRRPSTPME
jgi:hypothetical protein